MPLSCLFLHVLAYDHQSVPAGPDFYLWGYLKVNVYQDNPKTIPELKTAITTKIRTISREPCVRIIDNFARRIQVCLQRRGGHLEHIIQRQ